MSEAADVVVLCHRLDPVHGMERAALRLVDALRSERSVAVVCLHGSAPVPATTGWRAWAWLLRPTPRSSSPVTIVVGAWAAATFSVSPRRRGPYVLWEHSLLPARLAADRRLRLLARAARGVARRARAVVAVSNGVAATVQDTASVEATVIPNLTGVEAAHVPTRRRAGGPLHLVAVGALRPFKGQRLLLETLATQLPEATATIVGDGPDRAALEAEATARGLVDRVQFVGHVEDPAPYLAEADVLVHLSRYETFGFVVVEAAMAAVPVVTLDVACLDEVVPEVAPGWRVAPRPESIAAAVHEVVRSTTQEEFDQAAARRHERFDPDRIVRRWTAVLDGAPVEEVAS